MTWPMSPTALLRLIRHLRPHRLYVRIRETETAGQYCVWAALKPLTSTTAMLEPPDLEVWFDFANGKFAAIQTAINEMKPEAWIKSVVVEEVSKTGEVDPEQINLNPA